MRQESSWLSLYKQDVCEQLVKTHYEVVRGLALAAARLRPRDALTARVGSAG